jgi:hypothetical protein
MSMISRFGGIVALSTLFAFVAHAQENLGTWTHMRTITLNTSSTGAAVSGTVTDFPLLVRLGSAQSDVFTQAKAGGADLRFARPGGPSLPFQVERWDTVAKVAEIWVRVDTVLGNNASQTVRMFWGKASATDGSNGAAVFDTAAGYQGVWHFNSSLDDATRNAYHGLDNGTTDAAGAVGRGREFNGSANINLGMAPKMSTGDADRFTVEAWVNWSSIGTGGSDRYRTIINHGTANNADQFFMYARNPSSGGEDPYYSFGYYTGSVSNNATNPGIASDAGTWVHVAGTYDGAEWRVYRNGVLGGAAPKEGEPVNADVDWLIGSWGSSRYFLGSLDEIRFSNRVRGADWIKLGYETQKPGATAVSIGATEPASVAGASASRQAWWRAEDGGVTFLLPEGSGRVFVEVSDFRGRIVWSREADLASVRELRTPTLAPGHYSARLTRASGPALSAKFLVAK